MITQYYGLFDATKIVKKEKIAAHMVYNLKYPPVIVYNSYEELVNLTKVGNAPKKQA